MADSKNAQDQQLAEQSAGALSNRPPSDRTLTDSEKGKASPATVSLVESVNTESDLVNKFYEPPDTYESKHRWDPLATWTPQEEKALTRRLDLRVAAAACLCFFALNLDRYNISNAVADNLLDDLGMTTAEYNVGLTIFYASFLAAELPSQMLSKKLGSDVWIPIQMMSWSVVAIGQAGLKNKTGFYVTRGLLGAIEGGFIADTILYLSYYYTTEELTIRLSWFWVSLTGTKVFSAFLGAGLLQLRHHTNRPGWVWLFAIEGALTFLIGLWAFFYLPAGPTQTKGGLRGKNGWFSEREEVIIVNKVLRDDPTKSSMHNRQGLGLVDLWRALSDYDLWPLYAIGLVFFITSSTVESYFTLTLRSLGFSTFETNMLTIPSSCIFMINNVAISYLSRRTRERMLTASIAAWWSLILLVTIVTVPDSISKWARWAVLSLLMAYPYPHPIMVSTVSANSGSVATRTVASSVYNMFVQAATLIGPNIYQPSDRPYYHKGNSALTGIMSAAIVLFWFAKAYYATRNRHKAAKWDAMSLEDKDHYLATTTDVGNKRLDFRFHH